RKALPLRYGHVYWIENDKGDILIRKRTEKGILHNLWELPWEETTTKTKTPDIQHTFTHFKLFLKIIKADKRIKDGIWCSKEDLQTYAFSTLMQKVLKNILE